MICRTLSSPGLLPVTSVVPVEGSTATELGCRTVGTSRTSVGDVGSRELLPVNLGSASFAVAARVFLQLEQKHQLSLYSP